jgi:predicted membrane channel-forming protein YqfA (hemolysin III family)
MSNIWILFAILGVALVGASLTVIASSKAAMLGIVLGGVLLQAGVILFALTFGRERPRPRRRRYNVAGTAHLAAPPGGASA